MESNNKAKALAASFYAIQSQYEAFTERLNKDAGFDFDKELDFWLVGLIHRNGLGHLKNLYVSFSSEKEYKNEIVRQSAQSNDEYFRFTKMIFYHHYSFLQHFKEALIIYYNDPERYHKLSIFTTEDVGKKLSKEDFTLAVQLDIIHFFILFESLYQSIYPDYQRFLKKEPYIEYTISHRHISLDYPDHLKATIIDKMYQMLSKVGAIKIGLEEFHQHFDSTCTPPKIKWHYNRFVPLIGLFTGVVPSGGRMIKVNNQAKEDMIIDHFCKKNGEDFIRMNVFVEFIDTPTTKKPQKIKEFVELINDIYKLENS